MPKWLVVVVWVVFGTISLVGLAVHWLRSHNADSHQLRSVDGVSGYRA